MALLTPNISEAAGERGRDLGSGRLATLLLLAEGRFPAGGYAHSERLEPSI
jgi:hypothetical protein